MIVIVALAMRIAKQAKTAEGAVEVLRQQTAELDGIGQINDSGVRILHCRAGPAKGGGREMTLPLAVSDHTYWWIALAIGLAAALIVAGLLIALVRSVRSIEKSVDGLLEVAPKVAANTANIPQLEATAPVLGPDRGGSGRAGRLHERADRRVRWSMSTNDVLVLLSVVLALVVVGVLAAALIEVRRGLMRISEGLAALGAALQGVEAEHLRPLEGAVKAINAQFDVILGAMPGIAGKAAIVAERRPR